MEVEIKAKCPETSFPVIRKNLLHLDAVKKKEKRQIDQYYNPPHADWSKEKRYIRIRSEGENTIFAYHETLAHCLANEFETKIENKTVFEEALQRMGFQKLGLIEKNRETFQLGEFEICLDRVKGIGTFLEIETDGQPENFQEKEQGCRALLKKIGLDETALTAERLSEIATKKENWTVQK